MLQIPDEVMHPGRKSTLERLWRFAPGFLLLLTLGFTISAGIVGACSGSQKRVESQVVSDVINCGEKTLLQGIIEVLPKVFLALAAPTPASMQQGLAAMAKVVGIDAVVCAVASIQKTLTGQGVSTTQPVAMATLYEAPGILANARTYLATAKPVTNVP